MKNKYTISLWLLLLCSAITAQVSIGTNSPQGILDISASTTAGLVYPRVALTATNMEAPVVNPNGANLATGTTVYNTNSTAAGSNDVYPGLYVWDGTQWVAQFIKHQYQKFTQDPGCQRTDIKSTQSFASAVNVNGLGNQIFTPQYSGTYRVEVKTNYSAGEMRDYNTSVNKISLATAEGVFYFSMSGSGVSISPGTASYDYTQGWMYTHSYSISSTVESPSIKSNTIPHSETVVHYLTLRAGSPYNFSLKHIIATGGEYFLNGGDTGEGMGHVGHDIPCFVEFTYIGD